MERKHEELERKRKELEKVNGEERIMDWAIAEIDRLEKEKESGLRKRHTGESMWVFVVW